MTVSGTSQFTMTVDEIITEAYQRVLGEDITGFNARSARISLNLICQMLNARGINLWAVERRTLNLDNGVNRYLLDSDVVDVLEMWSRQAASINRRVVTLTNPFVTVTGSTVMTVTDNVNGAQSGDSVLYGSSASVGGLLINGTYQIVEVLDPNTYTIASTAPAASTATGGGQVSATYQATTDIIMRRMARDEYARQPGKSNPGDPYQFYLERLRDAPYLNLFPTPNLQNVTQLAYNIKRRIFDISGIMQTMDVPIYVLPAMISGLAWAVSQKRPQITPEQRAELKALYEADLELTLDENRDRSPLRIVPDMSRYIR